MKTIYLSIVLLFTVTILQAQEQNEVRTLFGSRDDHSNGGYGAISVGYTNIDNKDALLIGAQGAWVIDHNLAIGIAASGFTCDKKYDYTLSNEYRYAGGYGGILIEPIIAAKSPVHLSVPIIIGAGGVTYYAKDQDNDYYFYHDNSYEDSDAFFLFEPGVEIELNMISFFRIGLGISYRYTSDITLKYDDEFYNTPNPTLIGSSGMLRGLNYKLILKFGKF